MHILAGPIRSEMQVRGFPQQNETAVDVARRKEHPEIILIIQSLSRVRSYMTFFVKNVNSHLMKIVLKKPFHI